MSASPPFSIDLDEGVLVEGNRVTVRTEHGTAVYNLPRSAPRISVRWMSESRSELIIGGFKSLTVRLVGPTETIEKIREGVLT
jgi:hypothetical protein